MAKKTMNGELKQLRKELAELKKIKNRQKQIKAYLAQKEKLKDEIKQLNKKESNKMSKIKKLLPAGTKKQLSSALLKLGGGKKWIWQ